MEDNPWTEITVDKRILEMDRKIIEEHNEQYLNRDGRKVSIIDFPEPFLGDPKAEIYILLANPGRNKDQEKFTSKFADNNDLIKILLGNLNHDFSHTEYPFYFLDPKFEKHSGSKWWNNTFKYLIKGNQENRRVLSNEIFSAELYGYHTEWCERRLINNEEKLKSSEYSYHLVNRAIDDEKLIIVGRAVGDWFNKVPRLKEYENCHLLASNRGISFSRRTISPKAFMKIKDIMENSSK